MGLLWRANHAWLGMEARGKPGSSREIVRADCGQIAGGCGETARGDCAGRLPGRVRAAGVGGAGVRVGGPLAQTQPRKMITLGRGRVICPYLKFVVSSRQARACGWRAGRVLTGVAGGEGALDALRAEGGKVTVAPKLLLC